MAHDNITFFIYIQGKSRQYVEKLLGWIKECKFREVLILTSTFAHERRDAQLTGYASTENHPYFGLLAMLMKLLMSSHYPVDYLDAEVISICRL